MPSSLSLVKTKQKCCLNLWREPQANFVTKVDLLATKADLKADMLATKADLKADLLVTKADLKADMTAGLSQTESRITWKLLAISGGQLAILLAIVKLFLT